MTHGDSRDLSGTPREHAHTLMNYGPLSDYQGHARVTGSFGCTMEVWIAAENGKITRASFITDAGGAPRICGSIATRLAENSSFEEIASLQPQDVIDALGGLPEEDFESAALAVDALKAACEDCLSRSARASKNETSSSASSCESCSNTGCSAAHRGVGESEEEFRDRQRLQARLCKVRRKIVVMSGKGGVGKSTVAVNLAAALTMMGKKVGLLDVDIHGPSVPTMLGLDRARIRECEGELLPADMNGMKVISLGLFLRNQDDAVIWRGPMKFAAIKQFLTDVAWGDLDYLIIDSPPGTGDEPLTVFQLIGALDGAVIVTTPQKVAAVDVRKSINFCRQLKVPILGVVENMSGFACPNCGEITPIFQSGGGKGIAEDMGVPFLGSIPIDPKIAESCDAGKAFLTNYAETPTASIMRGIVTAIDARDEKDLRNSQTGKESS